MRARIAALDLFLLNLVSGVLSSGSGLSPDEAAPGAGDPSILFA